MNFNKAPRRIGLIGIGSVGSGWAAVYLARGYDVIASDPSPQAESRARDFVAESWGAMRRLGIASIEHFPQDKLRFVASPGEVAATADLVHENVPESLSIKQATYDEIETVASSDLIIASSTGGLPPSDLQARMKHPERLVVCHPFNPPHLIPLIEIVGGKNGSEIVEWALDFFRTLGKKPIRVDRETTAFLTNRLQFALLREAVHCLAEGIASPQAIEDAVRYGLGPRWAIMGSLSVLTLAGGPGGMPHVLSIAPELENGGARWVRRNLRRMFEAKLVAAAKEIAEGRTIPEWIDWRNEKLVNLLTATQDDA